MNQEIPDFQVGFRKGNGTRDQIAKTCWITEKNENFRKTSTSASLITLKPFDCVDSNKLWNIGKEMGIPDHITCLLRNLYAGQKATVRTGHGTKIWFQIRRSMSRLYIVTLLI